MDRRWGAFLIVTAAVLIFAGTVSAHEGLISLKNSSVACEGISVWRDDHYRVFGRCAGLVYPYAEKLTNYVLWVKDDNKQTRRIGSINDGQFDGSVDTGFGQVFISVESDAFIRQPGDIIVASGNVQPFDFSTLSTTPTPTQQILGLPLPTPTPTPAPAVVVNSLTKIGRQVGLTLAIIVGAFVAIIIAVLFVRRGQ